MRKRYILAFSFASIFYVNAQEYNLENLLREATAFEKQGTYTKAIELYESFLKQYPTHVQIENVLYRLALSYDAIGDIDRAKTLLDELLMKKGVSKNFKHRSEAFLKLAKLYGEGEEYEKAVEVLKKLLKEGADLYEDEAENMCAGYLAILGKFDEAAVMFNVLKNKKNSSFAREAAYKLAVVWMKSGDLDMARAAIEEFVSLYPDHPLRIELFIKLARAFVEKKRYKEAIGICEQVKDRFPSSSEAIEALFIMGLSYRDTGNIEAAIKSFDQIMRLPQVSHNTILASESLFEIAQLLRLKLNNIEKSMEYYAKAAAMSRNPLTPRQKLILEYSIFYQAEYFYSKGEWSAALDLYNQLRKLGSEINVLGRVMECQVKLSQSGEAVLFGESEDEINFIKQRIQDNPGSIIALQCEIFLLDRQLEELLFRREKIEWSRLNSLYESYKSLLSKYSEDILKQGDMNAYIYLRMADILSAVNEESGVSDVRGKWKEAFDLYNRVLAIAPSALFRIDALEGVAWMAGRLGRNTEALEAYAKLYELTGQKYTEEKLSQNRRRGSNVSSIEEDRLRYIRGMSMLANTPAMIEQTIKFFEDIISKGKEESVEVREARFYLAELYYMKEQYSETARIYWDFIKRYGPPLDENNNVVTSWRKPKTLDEVLNQVYEAGIRIAHCWYSQGHKQNMLKAYEWVIKNQDYQNPRVAEAKYMVITSKMAKKVEEMSPDERKDLAMELWKEVVNTSIDFGSKKFESGFFSWVSHPYAMPFVKIAILKSGKMMSMAGHHTTAANMFKTYLNLYSPYILDKNKKPVYPRDELYNMAEYMAGLEFALGGDYEMMAEIYKVYIDGLRDLEQRPYVLMLLGYYGVIGELFDKAAEAYTVLLDEYGPPNPLDASGKPIPVPKEKRLKPDSLWNGIRMSPPRNWDRGKIIYSLGYLYWRKEDWEKCGKVLRIFMDDVELYQNKYRSESLFMLAKSFQMAEKFAGSIDPLVELIEKHRDFKAIDEVYVDLARASVKSARWDLFEKYYNQFVSKFSNSPRRDYMELYRGISLLKQGRSAEGKDILISLTEAETYSDVKADAFYTLAMEAQRSSEINPEKIFQMLEKSIELHARVESLLNTARYAYQLKKYDISRRYLERCLNEFPKDSRKFAKEVETLMAEINRITDKK